MESNTLYSRSFLTAFAAMLVLWGAPTHSALVWHWVDPFTQAERQMLRPWLEQTHSALERYAGSLPFDVQLYMHRRDAAEEPVPWANTLRKAEQALYFHVDPSFSGDAFLNDWTAAHEFSHLLLPYLGQRNAWFAEGFASYLQHAVMVEMGVITQDEAVLRRDKKMQRAVKALADVSLSLPANMPQLKKRRAYPTFYWSGAVYFERVDVALQSKGSSLQSILRMYLDCCRLRRGGLDALVSTLDRLSESSLFSDELELMRVTPGMPARPGAADEYSP